MHHTAQHQQHDKSFGLHNLLNPFLAQSLQGQSPRRQPASRGPHRASQTVIIGLTGSQDGFSMARVGQSLREDVGVNTCLTNRAGNLMLISFNPGRTDCQGILSHLTRMDVPAVIAGY